MRILRRISVIKLVVVIGKIGKRLFPRIYNKVPRRADRILRYLRYVMLVAILVVTARIGKMAFESIDPYSALMNILSDEVAWGGLVFLAIVVVASLFIERPFCKYVCPFGAMLGLVSLVSIFRPRRNAATCIGCKKCDHACPMNITVSETTAVRDHQCISCYRCTSDDVCPVPNTVTLATPRLGQGAQVSEGADAKTQADQAKGSEVRHEN
ncbi:MAG: 4Fe-4S binding protein [Raoultibacter sp.]